MYQANLPNDVFAENEAAANEENEKKNKNESLMEEKLVKEEEEDENVVKIEKDVKNLSQVVVLDGKKAPKDLEWELRTDVKVAGRPKKPKANRKVINPTQTDAKILAQYIKRTDESQKTLEEVVALHNNGGFSYSEAYQDCATYRIIFIEKEFASQQPQFRVVQTDADAQDILTSKDIHFVFDRGSTDRLKKELNAFTGIKQTNDGAVDLVNDDSHSRLEKTFLEISGASKKKYKISGASIADMVQYYEMLNVTTSMHCCLEWFQCYEIRYREESAFLSTQSQVDLYDDMLYRSANSTVHFGQYFVEFKELLEFREKAWLTCSCLQVRKCVFKFSRCALLTFFLCFR